MKLFLASLLASSLNARQTQKQQTYKVLTSRRLALDLLRARRKTDFFEFGQNFRRECIEELCPFNEMTEVISDTLKNIKPGEIVGQLPYEGSPGNTKDKQAHIDKEWMFLRKRCLAEPCNAKSCFCDGVQQPQCSNCHSSQATITTAFRATEICNNNWNNRKCECGEGWEGDACEIEKRDACADASCNNGQISVAYAGGLCICECRPGEDLRDGVCVRTDEVEEESFPCVPGYECIDGVRGGDINECEVLGGDITDVNGNIIG